MKKHLALLLIMIFAGVVFSFAQEAESVIVKGSIEQIADDGSYIIVSGKKILTTKELVDEAYFEIKDKVEIKAEESPQGLRALSYEYIYEEESEHDDSSDPTHYDESSFGQ